MAFSRFSFIVFTNFFTRFRRCQSLSTPVTSPSVILFSVIPSAVIFVADTSVTDTTASSSVIPPATPVISPSVILSSVISFASTFT